MNREGHGGGFKELDEEEVAEARRRREEFENDDTEMCAPDRAAVAAPSVCLCSGYEVNSNQLAAWRR